MIAGRDSTKNFVIQNQPGLLQFSLLWSPLRVFGGLQRPESMLLVISLPACSTVTASSWIGTPYKKLVDLIAKAGWTYPSFPTKVSLNPEEASSSIITFSTSSSAIDVSILEGSVAIRTGPFEWSMVSADGDKLLFVDSSLTWHVFQKLYDAAAKFCLDMSKWTKYPDKLWLFPLHLRLPTAQLPVYERIVVG